MSVFADHFPSGSGVFLKRTTTCTWKENPMTTFNATEYANGLSVKVLNADLASGGVTKAQALAACKAKLARENIRKGARTLDPRG